MVGLAPIEVNGVARFAPGLCLFCRSAPPHPPQGTMERFWHSLRSRSAEHPAARKDSDMERARLLISSRNYSSWSLRGFLIARLAGLDFEVERVDLDDPAARAELLMRASSTRIPCLLHEGLRIWDTTAIAAHLHEAFPEAGMLPTDRAARARCRSISGEMHAGFQALRASLPMNLRAHRPGFRVWAGPQADIDRILFIWRDCLETWRGPWLFGSRPSVADAMYAPVVTRLLTYDVPLAGACAAYAGRIMEWAPMAEWLAAAQEEPEPDIHELEVEAEF